MHPFLGVAAELRARGHAVKVIASAYYQSLIGALGLDFVPIGTAEEFLSVARDPQVWHWFRGFGRIGASIGRAVAPCYKANIDNAVKGNTILVYSTLAFGARLAQERLRLPGVSIHLSPAIFRSSYDPPVLKGMPVPAWLPGPAKRMLFALSDRLFLDRIFGKELNAFGAELGLPRVRHVLSRWCHSPQRVIGLFPSWYAAPQRDWPKQTVLTGFALFDESQATPMPEEAEKFLDAGSPPIAFTPGSAMLHGHKFFAAAVEACGILGRRALLLTRHGEQIPSPLPPQALHVPYAPFSRLLPRCAGLVHHGGIGSTAQGMAAGLPQLLMPMSFDQPDNARRLARLGIGDWLPPAKFTGKAVAGKLNALLGSETVRDACQEVAGRFNVQEPPVAHTARLIEELIPTV